MVADADLRTRSEVRTTLEAHGYVVCAEAADADEAVAATASLHPDVVLVDVALPGNGIRAAADMGTVPGTIVIMLTASRAPGDILDSLRAGAAGYLLKETAVSRLPNVLGAVMGGEAAIPRALVGTLVEEIRSQSDRRHRLALAGKKPGELTAREWEVLQLLAGGCTTAQIAERLFIAKVTVRSHISAALHKLGAPDRAAARRLLAPAIDR